MFILVKKINEIQEDEIFSEGNNSIKQAVSIYRPDFELLDMDKSNGKFRKVTWEEKFLDLQFILVVD